MPTILLKKSDTPGSVPGTANLTNLAGGVEVAVNTADKRMFSMTSASAVIELGTNPSSLTCADASFTVARITSLTISSLSLTNATFASATITNLTSTSATISSALTLSGGTANGVLYLNGSKVATSGSALTFDGSLLKLGSGAALSVQGVAFPSSGSGAEIFWDGSESIVQSYNRTSAAYVPLWLESSYTRFGINGVAKMTLDSSGNLGLGVTPSAWGSSYKAIQLPAGAISADSTAVIEMRQNSRWTGSANVYVNNGFASNYYQYNGTHAWFTAPSGTAGNAISFSQVMTLDASGNLAVASAGSPSYNRITITNNTGSAITGMMQANNGGSTVNIGSFTNHPVTFVTNDTERARITASGLFGVGTTSPSYRLDISEGGGTNAIVNAARFYADAAAAAESRILFGTAANTVSAAIGAQTDSGSTSILKFYVDSAGGLVESARIDTTGNFIVGGTAALGTASNRGNITVNGSSNSILSLGVGSVIKGYVFHGGTDMQVFNAANGYVAFGTNDTERARITAGGAFGLGTSSPNKVGWDSNAQVMTIFGPQRGALEIGSDSPITNDQCGNISFMSGTTQKAQIQCRLDGSSNGDLVFYTGSTERVRITDDGNLGVGTDASYKIQTTVASGADRDMFLSGVTGVTNGVHWKWTNSSSTINFSFGVLPTTASAANAYIDNAAGDQLLRSTSSIRYKKDVEDIDHAFADAALNLRPVWYRSKAEGDKKEWSWYGLIAEEVAEVEPRLVHWTYPEDAFDVETVDGVIKKTVKDGAERIPDGVQYERLSVLLLDIVKRQNARLEQLEAKVAALEAK